MKHILLIAFFYYCSFAGLHAQEISLKYGNVTNDELVMKVYDKDTTATAVVLYDNGYSNFEFSKEYNRFITKSIFRKKIKILKQEGVRYASVSLPYIYVTSGDREQIEGLEAAAYNIENGKRIETKLEKEYIFNEDINNRYKQVKFSIPNVKTGTVIEYKFTKSSSYISSLPNWDIQTDIPTLNSIYEIAIPEFFIYNMETKGYEHMDVTETRKEQNFVMSSVAGVTNSLSSSSRDLKIIAKDIPALRNERYLWYPRDFISGVHFELCATKFPGDSYRAYTNTWIDLEKTLREKTDFVSSIEIANPYKEEIKALIKNTTDENQKIELIYNFIKKQIRWDATYSLFGKDAKESVKKGTGNNAQINTILMSALKDAGFWTYPILIRPRNMGRLPLNFPSINKISTFIVAAEKSDHTVIFMDGSALYGGPNTLPNNLLVDMGYIFEPGHADKWVNLTNISRNEQKNYTKATLDKDGNLKGETRTTFTNQKSYSYKETLSGSKNTEEYINKIQDQNQISVDSFSVTGKDSMNNIAKEKFLFSKKVRTNQEYMYINPMIFPHITRNGFTQTERKLPVEFDYPYSFTQICNITIPDNYTIDELPKSMEIALGNTNGSCSYQIGQTNNTIQLIYRFNINQTIFSFTEYQSLRDFFGQVAVKNSEMIVLKKKNI